MYNFFEELPISEKGSSEDTHDFVPINRPKTNHQLTINMAKHIAMVQRSEVAEEIRQYFIDVETEYRKLFSVETDKLLYTDPITQALNMAGDRVLAATKLGMDVGIARLHAINQVERELNVNLSTWKQLLPPSDSYDVPALTPTQIANILGEGMTARKVNQLLLQLNFQTKPVNDWLLTEAGKQHAVIIPFYNASAAHYGFQIKWKITIVDVLKNFLNNAE